MKTITSALVAVLFIIGTFTESEAIPSVWGVWDWQIDDPVHIVVSPGGHGTSLTNAEFFGGNLEDATIRIQLWIDDSDTGDPPNPHFVPGFPAEDIWLEIPDLNLCFGLSHPDGPTDSQGWFTFSGSPGMGGWNDPASGPPYAQVMVVGNILFDETGHLISPTIVANSPDINADLTVNLIDLSLFSSDYFGSYSFRSDFFWDGEINLIDLASMALFFGDTCP
jgi:hypothetical protein